MATKAIPVDIKLVAACGLYCGACRSYLKGSCPGCRENAKASWCGVRTCNLARGAASCADCSEHPDPKTCKKFHSPVSRIFGFVFNSDRAACIGQIREKGLEGHAQAMAASGRQSISRKAAKTAA